MSQNIVPDSPSRPLKQINPFAINAPFEMFSVAILLKTIDNTITKQLSLWPEEEQALEDIQTGKTRMITQSGEDFLKDLDELVNGS